MLSIIPTLIPILSHTPIFGWLLATVSDPNAANTFTQRNLFDDFTDLATASNLTTTGVVSAVLWGLMSGRLVSRNVYLMAVDSAESWKDAYEGEHRMLQQIYESVALSSTSLETIADLLGRLPDPPNTTPIEVEPKRRIRVRKGVDEA